MSIPAVPSIYSGKLPSGMKLNQPYTIECDTDNISRMTLSYENKDRHLDLFIRKNRDGTDDSSTSQIKKSVDSSFENASIISSDGGNTFYSYSFTTDGYDIRANFSDKNVQQTSKNFSFQEFQEKKFLEMIKIFD